MNKFDPVTAAGLMGHTDPLQHKPLSRIQSLNFESLLKEEDCSLFSPKGV